MGRSYTLRHRSKSRGQRGGLPARGPRPTAPAAHQRELAASAAARMAAAAQQRLAAVSRALRATGFSSHPVGNASKQKALVEKTLPTGFETAVKKRIEDLPKRLNTEEGVIQYREGLPAGIPLSPSVLPDSVLSLIKVLNASNERVKEAREAVERAQQQIANLAAEKMSAQEQKKQKAIRQQNATQLQQALVVAEAAAQAARERLAQTMDFERRKELLKENGALAHAIRELGNKRILFAIQIIVKNTEGTPYNRHLNTEIAKLQYKLEPLNTTKNAVNSVIFVTSVVLDDNNRQNVEVTPDLTAQIEKVNAELKIIAENLGKLVEPSRPDPSKLKAAQQALKELPPPPSRADAYVNFLSVMLDALRNSGEPDVNAALRYTLIQIYLMLTGTRAAKDAYRVLLVTPNLDLAQKEMNAVEANISSILRYIAEIDIVISVINTRIADLTNMKSDDIAGIYKSLTKIRDSIRLYIRSIETQIQNLDTDTESYTTIIIYLVNLNGKVDSLNGLLVSLEQMIKNTNVPPKPTNPLLIPNISPTMPTEPLTFDQINNLKEQIKTLGEQLKIALVGISLPSSAPLPPAKPRPPLRPKPVAPSLARNVSTELREFLYTTTISIEGKLVNLTIIYKNVPTAPTLPVDTSVPSATKLENLITIIIRIETILIGLQNTERLLVIVNVKRSTDEEILTARIRILDSYKPPQITPTDIGALRAISESIEARLRNLLNMRDGLPKPADIFVTINLISLHMNENTFDIAIFTALGNILNIIKGTSDNLNVIFYALKAARSHLPTTPLKPIPPTDNISFQDKVYRLDLIITLIPQLIIAYRAANRSFMILVPAPDGTRVTILFGAIQNANGRTQILTENIIDTTNALPVLVAWNILAGSREASPPLTRPPPQPPPSISQQPPSPTSNLLQQATLDIDRQMLNLLSSLDPNDPYRVLITIRGLRVLLLQRNMAYPNGLLKVRGNTPDNTLVTDRSNAVKLILGMIGDIRNPNSSDLVAALIACIIYGSPRINRESLLAIINSLNPPSPNGRRPAPPTPQAPNAPKPPSPSNRASLDVRLAGRTPPTEADPPRPPTAPPSPLTDMLQEYQKLANDLSKITNGLQNLKSLQERAVQLQSLINAAGNLGNPQYDGNLADLTSKLSDLNGQIAEALASITRIQQRINGMTKVSMPEGFDNLQQHLDDLQRQLQDLTDTLQMVLEPVNRDTTALEMGIENASAIINRMNLLLLIERYLLGEMKTPTGSLQGTPTKPTGPERPNLNIDSLISTLNSLISGRDGLNATLKALSQILEQKLNGDSVNAVAKAKRDQGDPPNSKGKPPSQQKPAINGELKMNMDTLNAEKARLEANLNDAQAKLNEAIQQGIAPKRQLDKLRAEIDKLKAKLSELKNEMDSIKTEIDRIKVEITKTTDPETLKKLQENLEKLNTELENKRKELKILNDDNERLKKEIDDLTKLKPKQNEKNKFAPPPILAALLGGLALAVAAFLGGLSSVFPSQPTNPEEGRKNPQDLEDAPDKDGTADGERDATDDATDDAKRNGERDARESIRDQVKNYRKQRGTPEANLDEEEEGEGGEEEEEGEGEKEEGEEEKEEEEEEEGEEGEEEEEGEEGEEEEEEEEEVPPARGVRIAAARGGAGAEEEGEEEEFNTTTQGGEEFNTTTQGGEEFNTTTQGGEEFNTTTQGDIIDETQGLTGFQKISVNSPADVPATGEYIPPQVNYNETKLQNHVTELRTKSPRITQTQLNNYTITYIKAYRKTYLEVYERVYRETYYNTYNRINPIDQDIGDEGEVEEEDPNANTNNADPNENANNENNENNENTNNEANNEPNENINNEPANKKPPNNEANNESNENINNEPANKKPPNNEPLQGGTLRRRPIPEHKLRPRRIMTAKRRLKTI